MEPFPAGEGLARAVIGLAGELRGRGVRTGSKGVMDGLRSALAVGPGSAADLRRALAANLVHSPEEEEIFNRLFDLHLLGRGESGEREPSVLPGRGPEQVALSLVRRAGPEEAGQGPRLSPYSPVEVLGRRDLRAIGPDEIGPHETLLAERMEALLTHPSRRRRPGQRKRRVDFRRTFRRSLDSGGEILKLAHSGPKPKRRRLILLLDVSGSMTAHTRFMLLFARTWLKARPRRVEVFAFSTRLRRLTPLLRDRTWDQSLAEIGRLMPEWSGGTRIGRALAQLLSGQGRGVVGPTSLVTLVSDGWDRGDTDLLQRQMARLARRAWRVVWLNPLLGSPGYEPLCAGMKAALRHLDLFLPAHSLDSLVEAGRIMEAELGR